MAKFNSVFFAIFLLLNGCEGTSPASDNATVPDGKTKTLELIQNALEEQEKGAFEEAIEILNQALKSNPRLVLAHFRMGRVYEEWDKRQEAIQAYTKAIEIEASHEGSRLGLASVHSKSNRNDLAIREYKLLATTRPEDAELQFKLALEYWYIQMFPESAGHYRKVIEIEPDHMQAHLNLISVYEQMKEWENAIDEIEIATRLGKETNDAQAVAIAERKLQFIKGRMNFTDNTLNRKTQPPFE